jgi:hypothetical protein
MVSRGPAWLDIHEHQVQAFIRPGGEVRALVDDIAREVKRYSYLYILDGHWRSGRLIAGLYSNVAKDTGPLSAFSRAGSSAAHTRYFMEETGPEIYPNGPYLLVPRKKNVPQMSSRSKGAGSELYAAWKDRGKKGGKGFFQKKSVRGYKAHPFLQEGLAIALRSRGL